MLHVLYLDRIDVVRFEDDETDFEVYSIGHEDVGQ